MSDALVTVEKKGQSNSLYYIVSFLLGFTLSFGLLYVSPNIFGEASQMSTFLYYLTFGLLKPWNAYAFMSAFEIAIGIVIGYVSLKAKSYMVLCFSLGVGLCPIVLSILGAAMPSI